MTTLFMQLKCLLGSCLCRIWHRHTWAPMAQHQDVRLLRLCRYCDATHPDDVARFAWSEVLAAMTSRDTVVASVQACNELLGPADPVWQALESEATMNGYWNIE